VPALNVGGGTEYVGRPASWGRERVEEWEHLHYHQPSDQLDDTWNLDGAIDDLRLLSTVALRVANAKSAPTWTPGDEFEAPRKRGLQALPKSPSGGAPGRH